MTPTSPLPRRTPQGSPSRGADAPVPPVEWRMEPARTTEALEARDALAAALSQAGIQLPAMDVRTPWADTIHPHGPATAHAEEHEAERTREVRYALIHLGICSAPVALALAAVIRNGAAR
ncbi:hypothetical protein [Streptomyces sp. NBC_01618]|uniref:hypothetical protein n=1 Tax=Streptomyces sp. NBC_01618 TaxID=2975900 RepID=UPI00386F7B09|nr:hypothetical protein OH735_28725 [Streptomyces sp. NBC_01618]